MDIDNNLVANSLGKSQSFYHINDLEDTLAYLAALLKPAEVGWIMSELLKDGLGCGDENGVCVCAGQERTPREHT